MKNFYLRVITLMLSAIMIFCAAGCKYGCGGKRPGAIPTDIPPMTEPPLPHVSESYGSLVHGNRISFGTYEQDGDETNGKEPIEWVVSETWMTNNKHVVMLISEKCLFVAPFNEKLEEVTWATCSLRKYLNNEFVEDAFSEDEQAILLENQMQTLPNPNFTEPTTGITTKDRVFIPDYGDYNEFDMFIDERAELTEAAKKSAEGLEKYIENSWWLRTEGQDKKSALTMSNSAEVIFEAGDPVDSNCGVRVAVWLIIDGSQKD